MEIWNLKRVKCTEEVPSELVEMAGERSGRRKQRDKEITERGAICRGRERMKKKKPNSEKKKRVKREGEIAERNEGSKKKKKASQMWWKCMKKEIFFFLIQAGLEQKERKRNGKVREWWKRSHNGLVCRVDLVPTLDAASPQFS